MGRKLAAVLVSSALMSGSAAAAVITFDDLAGSTNDIIASYSEDGFTVSPSSGFWREDHDFGNSEPSIFTSSENAALEITESSSASFTFSSFDIADVSQTGPFVGFTLQGFLGAVEVYSDSGNASASFQTIASPDPTADIDRLSLSFDISNLQYNIDNIVLNEQVPPPPPPRVPAPATGLLLGIGLACLSVRRRP